MPSSLGLSRGRQLCGIRRRFQRSKKRRKLPAALSECQIANGYYSSFAGPNARRLPDLGSIQEPRQMALSLTSRPVFRLLIGFVLMSLAYPLSSKLAPHLAHPVLAWMFGGAIVGGASVGLFAPAVSSLLSAKSKTDLAK